MNRKVILEPYSKNWTEDFERESEVITKILGTNLAAIHHIGSTSIPNIKAKPIIDIMPVVHSLLEVDDVKNKFTELGYLFRGEFGISGRRYIVGLMPDQVNHRVHIHIFNEGNDEIKRHLFFRNILIKKPELARAYEALKIKLQHKYELERDKYQEGKSDFCEQVLIKEMGTSYCPPSSK